MSAAPTTKTKKATPCDVALINGIFLWLNENYRAIVVFSESHLMSFKELPADLLCNATLPYVTFGLFSGPFHLWISEWPSAKERPAAPL